MFAMNPSRLLCTRVPLFAFAFLITCSSTALQGQAEEEEQARAQTLRLAGSSKAEDRELAVKRLRAIGMDFPLLWKLMNDAAPSVRLHAIDGITHFGCTVVVDMTPELAQKMILMLEQEVTQEHIDTAFNSGQIQDAAASLVACSMLALDTLYAGHPQFLKARADGARWQDVALHPLIVKLAAARRETSDFVDFRYLRMVQHIEDVGLLMIELKTLGETLDDEKLPSSRLLATVETLWRDHPLLGEGSPMNLQLLEQLAPRLKSLKLRILGPMTEGPDKEHAADLLDYIAQFIQMAREKFTLQPARAAGK
jgi:hypothetical protein